jgi:hypothetical protein
MEIKPNFFIIGAPKSGTTSLASLLRWHPEAGIVDGKEANYFSYDAIFAQGWEKYLAKFSECAGKKAVGDASTSYCRIRFHPHTIERIYERVPEAKIIYMARHPLQRMESGYIEMLCTPAGQTMPSLMQALRRFPMIIDSSRYWEVFDAYRKKFGEEKIKVIFFEDYLVNQMEHFRDVCRFLQITDTCTPDLSREMTNSRDQNYKRLKAYGRDPEKIDTHWDQDTRQWVIAQIRDDNLHFLEHFGKPRNYWGELF